MSKAQKQVAKDMEAYKRGELEVFDMDDKFWADIEAKCVNYPIELEIAKGVWQGLADVKAGRTKDIKEFWDELK